MLYALVKSYYKKPRQLVKRGVEIKLYPTVFHPSLYHSTDIFLDYILTLPIQSKSILELGAGNGLISLYLAKNKGCTVYSSDINPIAVKGLEENARSNHVMIQAMVSDLFDDLPAVTFDYIFVNPPYYAKAISSIDEYAFYTGDQLEYFHRFFKQLDSHIKNNTCILCILSESAPFDTILSIAKKNYLTLKRQHQKKRFSEWFYIYRIFSTQ